MQILNFIKSVYFNLRYLPFKQAVYLPIWITTNFKVMKLKRGQIILDHPYRRNFFLGDCGSLGLQQFKGGVYLDEGATLKLHAMCVIGQGSVLRCDKNATMELGRNFYCNKNCYLRSTKDIIFGDDCSLGWNVQINTDDGHAVRHNEIETKRQGSIIVGNHVWITSNAIITKEVQIADGCVIAQGAVVTKSLPVSKSLYGGVPAKIVSQNVEWSK